MTTLFDIIAQTESANIPTAQRFEPGVYDRVSHGAWDDVLTNVQKANRGCTHATCEVFYSTSYGATQIMGFNLYGPLGYTKDVNTFLNTPADQRAMFELFIEKKNIIYSVETLCSNLVARQRFGTIYNGNAGLYVPMMERAMRFLGLQVAA